MSAFLGPIHYWLHRKIQLQEDLTESILSAVATKKESRALEKKLKTEFGEVERRPLEEVIDTGNIHGWLQSQIEIAEKRFAAAVTQILAENLAQIENLSQAAYRMGQKNHLQDTDAQEIYQALNNMLLDGMPCDHVNEILEQSENHVIWKQTADLHEPFWKAVNGNVEYYYLLRNAFISGSLLDNRFTFLQTNNQFVIREV